MKKIAVIGSGTMGLEIAQIFAGKGYTVNVLIRGLSPEIVTAKEVALEKTLAKRVAKGRLDEEGKQQLMENISFEIDIHKAADADLVLEAIIEDFATKERMLSELDKICKPETILATNTSSLSITALGATTRRADRFIGMHFFNPPLAMKLVEIVRGADTSDETFSTIYLLTQEIGKDPIEVSDAPGFVVNKILIPMINEACDLVYTGIASAADVDKAMKLGANHPMGPLALADLVGLDVCLAIMDTIFSDTHDSKYRASMLLRKMVRSGNLGRKTGKGFFEYNR